MKKIFIALMLLALPIVVSADGLRVTNQYTADYSYTGTLNTAETMTDANGDTSSPVGFATIGTCNVAGTAGTLSLDIKGSVDGTNWADLYAAITANGNYSFSGMPFSYLRIVKDACSGGCTVTVECKTGRY